MLTGREIRTYHHRELEDTSSKFYGGIACRAAFDTTLPWEQEHVIVVENLHCEASLGGQERRGQETVKG